MQSIFRHSCIAWLAAMVILLTLALRMTITETVRTAFSDRVAALTDPTAVQTPQPGPAHTVAFTVIVLLATAAVLATHKLCKQDKFFLMGFGTIAALLLASTFSAQNKFTALAGSCDVIMSLAAAMALLILGRDMRIKQLFIAAIMAITTVWIAKGFYQYYIEVPETVKFIEDNWDQILKQRGWQEEDSQAKLFLARVHSREITGYITFSNVVAAGMIPMILLALALTWQFFASSKTKSAHTQPESTSPGLQKNAVSNEIPLLPVIAVLAGLLTAAGACLLVLSDSKGGIGAFAICLPLVTAGMIFPKQVAIHRKKLLIAAGILTLIGTVTVVGYGLKNNGLPSLSLLYRWHYWQGAAQMVERAPLLGVGLNNFGDYYTQVKPPQSPEDVKDPHGFFVRFASECGIPVMMIVAVLIFWLIARSLRPRQLPESPIWSKPALFGIALLIFVWWFARLFIAEVPDLAFNVIMAVLNAALAASVVALTLTGLGQIASHRISILLNVLVVGACGMLLYDQINMGLVTGPVAMFFWCILAVAAAPDSDPEHYAPRMMEKTASGIIAVGAITLLIFVVGPLATDQFAWDPTPWENRALRAATPQDALNNWNEAVSRNPRSVELLRRRIQAKVLLGQPIENDIELLLSLNTTDAKVWMDVGLMPSGLSSARKKEILERALRLDDLMPADQPRKLQSIERDKINASIKILGEM